MLPEWKKVGIFSKFLQVNLQEKYFQEDLGGDWRTIFQWILIGTNTINWIDSTQDRD